MRFAQLTVCSALGLLAAAGPGQARLTSPRFFTLDRPDARFGGELLVSEVFIDSQASDFGGEADLHGRRIDLFLQIGFEQPDGSRHGGYLQIARTGATVELGSDEESIDGTLSPELGYVFVATLGQTSELVLRFGLTATGSDSLESLAAGALTTPARLTDFVLLYPEVGLLRVAVSPRGQVGRFFYQVDFGLDLPAYGDNSDDADPLIRTNGAAGVALEVVELGVELVNLVNLDDDELEEGALHTFTLGARFALGAFRPGVGFTLPLDEDFEEIQGALQLSLGAQLDDLIR